jgi:hypothetical protein
MAEEEVEIQLFSTYKVRTCSTKGGRLDLVLGSYKSKPTPIGADMGFVFVLAKIQVGSSIGSQRF